MNPAPDSSPVLYYRIQKGDSAWRVAAALTGSGLNWQLLWPELKNKPIQIGDVLEVHIDRLEALRRDRAQH
jgi:cobalamin biosynthesis protein CbiG